MIRTDMSNDAYHLDPAISSSDVKAVYNKSLLHWKYSVRKETAAFDLGSAVHAMVLEPDLELVRRGPADRRGDKWKDAKMAADLDGIILLPEGEYDVAETIAANVLANMPAWMDRAGYREASFFARDRLADLNTKCRPDIFIPDDGLVIDLKTCQSASPRMFSRDVHTYAYNLQAAFYLRVLQDAGFEADRFVFLAVEKEPPYAVGIHEIDADYLDTSHAIVTQMLLKIRDAKETNSYTTGWPEINMIGRPGWLLADDPEDL